jgi:hypothetical protein
MDILSGFGSDLFSGHRIIRVKSWDDWKKLQIPSNCELMGIDEDPDKNYLYMKRSDTYGNTKDARYKYTDDPVKEFDPEKYVTVDQFNELMEKVNNGFDSIQQSIAARGGTGPGNNQKLNNGNK